MKLFDVNVLILAHRVELQGHKRFNAWLINLLEGSEPFFYCEWVLSAFVRVMTNPRVFGVTSPTNLVLDAARAIRTCPHGLSIMPGPRHWDIFEELCRRTGATGDLVPDAYLAALAIEADAEWVTSDRDFERFEPDLELTLLRPS